MKIKLLRQLDLLLLLILHFVLKHVLASQDISAVIISGGSDIPTGIAGLSVSFLFIRLALVLLLPGLLLSRLVFLAMELRKKRQTENTV